MERSPPDAAGCAQRLQACLQARSVFYGRSAALLDETGTFTGSPYAYRAAYGYPTLDLTRPDYHIEAQAWITMPLAADAAVRTRAKIWMIARSVPACDSQRIFAVATTDPPVNDPGQ